MTELKLRQHVADYLKAYIGIKEGSAKHKELLKIFNDSRLCTRYSMTVYDPWCATAVSAAFIATGNSNMFPCVECSCANMIALAKKNGMWVEDDSYVPSIGDVIMYDWNDSGTGDNRGIPNHTGIVSAIKGNDFTVIEGNYKDTVGYRKMKVDGKYIRGYITPKYDVKKSVNQIAKEVIAGKWGNGEQRKKNLAEAGYTYSTIQNAVNNILKGVK